MQPVWARAPAWRCALRMFSADEQTLRPPWVQDVLRVRGIANQRLKIPESDVQLGCTRTGSSTLVLPAAVT